MQNLRSDELQKHTPEYTQGSMQNLRSEEFMVPSLLSTKSNNMEQSAS
jgi:hypothetical protein